MLLLFPLLAPFYKCSHRDPERFRSLPRVSHSVRVELGFRSEQSGSRHGHPGQATLPSAARGRKQVCPGRPGRYQSFCRLAQSSCRSSLSLIQLMLYAPSSHFKPNYVFSLEDFIVQQLIRSVSLVYIWRSQPHSERKTCALR